MSVAHRWTRSAARANCRGWRTVTGVLAAGVVASSAACAGGGGAPQAPAPEEPRGAAAAGPRESGESRFHAAMDHVRRDEFGEAAGELARLAETCESGPWGRNAILLLASLELNPRNASGSPSSGAHLAARYLQIPAAPEASVAVAETLYLLAVDLGAEPVTDPLGTPSGTVETAFAFEDCTGSEEPVLVRELPQHPGPATTRAALASTSAQRDSLAAVADSLALRAAELEAELARIRRLLVPDSVGGGEGSPPPGR